ncbi:MAG: hypothetical protein JWO27_1346, partial [Frankiales bacterium]|nr:hypothetical protein [Frankiales bacterium]
MTGYVGRLGECVREPQPEQVVR